MVSIEIKNLLVLWVCLLLCSAGGNKLTAQVVYQQVKARGEIKHSGTGKLLQRGEKFKANDVLEFSSAKDAAVVIDQNKGAFLIYPEASLKRYRTKPLPAVGARPGLVLTDLELRQLLHSEARLLLLNGQFRLVLGQQAFPMDETRFFYLEYLWKGEPINKKLRFAADTLIIDWKEVYTVDGQPIDPSDASDYCFLRYYDMNKAEVTAYPDLEQPIYLVRTPMDELEAEVRMILAGEKGEHIVKVANYLKAMYGQAGGPDIEDWLKSLGY
jgi:hypothetical protein